MNRPLPLSSLFINPTTDRSLSIAASQSRRRFHISQAARANPLSVTQPGPPPSAPLPKVSQYGEQVDRRRRQAQLIRQGQELRTSQVKPSSSLKKRFWKDVRIETEAGMSTSSSLPAGF